MPPSGSTIERQVMTNYEIHGPARVCAATGRELRAGEKVYSVLRDELGQFVLGNRVEVRDSATLEAASMVVRPSPDVISRGSVAIIEPGRGLAGD